METILIPVILFTAAAGLWEFSKVNPAVRDALAADGIEPQTVKFSWTKGNRNRWAHVDFTGTDRATGEPVHGHAEVQYWTHEVTLHYRRESR